MPGVPHVKIEAIDKVIFKVGNDRTDVLPNRTESEPDSANTELYRT